MILDADQRHVCLHNFKAVTCSVNHQSLYTLSARLQDTAAVDGAESTDHDTSDASHVGPVNVPESVPFKEKLDHMINFRSESFESGVLGCSSATDEAATQLPNTEAKLGWRSEKRNKVWAYDIFTDLTRCSGASWATGLLAPI